MARFRGPAFSYVMRCFLRDQRGATAIEYGLLAGMIALVVIVVMSKVFTNIGGTLNYIGSLL
jgi:pilus assembly protein Flp/PilA